MFYDILKRLCKKKNITVKDLCDYLGMSTGNTGSWKSGKTPSIKVLQKIADYFDVSTDYLLGKETKPSSIEEELGDFQFALYGETKEFSEAQKRDILKFARFLKGQDKDNDDN